MGTTFRVGSLAYRRQFPVATTRSRTSDNLRSFRVLRGSEVNIRSLKLHQQRQSCRSSAPPIGRQRLASDRWLAPTKAGKTQGFSRIRTRHTLGRSRCLFWVHPGIPWNWSRNGIFGGMAPVSKKGQRSGVQKSRRQRRCRRPTSTFGARSTGLFLPKLLPSGAPVRFTRKAEFIVCGDCMTLWTREPCLKNPSDTGTHPRQTRMDQKIRSEPCEIFGMFRSSITGSRLSRSRSIY